MATFHSAKPSLDAARKALASGQSDRALALLSPLLESHASDAMALQQAGVILADAQRHADALTFFQRSVDVHPSFARGHFNIALALRALGRPVDAEHECRHAMQLAPTAPEPVIELADLIGHSERTDLALALLEANAVQFAGSDRFHAMHAVLLKRAGRQIEAAEALRRAIALAPRAVSHRSNLALILNEIGRVDDADAVLAPMLAARPPANIRLRSALMLPGVMQSVEQIDHTRMRLQATLDELCQSSDRVTDPMAALNSLPFYLAYAGRDDRPILEKLAAVHEQICPTLTFTAPHVNRSPARSGHKIRLGVISTYLYRHTIGKLNLGLIKHIDRSRFEVFVLENPIDDPIANHIRAVADHLIPVPGSFSALRQSITSAELDIIFYPDIGMVPMMYYLAFARLAPLQCVTWGHPVTCGIRTMDYFLSATHLETAGSESQYTERLHRFTVPGTCYARPTRPAIAGDRSRFGFGSDWHVYVCPQTLFKIHPVFDAILARILRRSRRAYRAAGGQSRRHVSGVARAIRKIDGRRHRTRNPVAQARRG